MHVSCDAFPRFRDAVKLSFWQEVTAVDSVDAWLAASGCVPLSFDLGSRGLLGPALTTDGAAHDKRASVPGYRNWSLRVWSRCTELKAPQFRTSKQQQQRRQQQQRQLFHGRIPRYQRWKLVNVTRAVHLQRNKNQEKSIIYLATKCCVSKGQTTWSMEPSAIMGM